MVHRRATARVTYGLTLGICLGLATPGHADPPQPPPPPGSCSVDTDCGNSNMFCGEGTCLYYQAPKCQGATFINERSEKIDCSPYMCFGARCMDACDLSDSCTLDTICYQHKCVDPSIVPDSGCGCSEVGSQPRASWSWGLLALFALASMTRRRHGLRA